MSSHVTNPRRRRPGFFGQALLVVLPVAVLTVLGLLSLRQDRLLAEQEARERAGRLAQEAADRAMASLFTGEPFRAPNSGIAPGVNSSRPAFALSPQGELLWPPPVAAVPQPSPLDPSRLTPNARDAWVAAQRASADGNGEVAAEAWSAFLATDPPADFAANARFELALAEVRRGALETAEAHFRQVAMEYGSTRGESGLPLAPLALWRADELALRAARDADARLRRIQDACSNLVFHPTAITPSLLEHLARETEQDSESTTPGGTNSIAAWRQLWETTELARALFAAARQAWERQSLFTANESGESDSLPVRPAPAPLWVTLSPVSSASATPLAADCDGREWFLAPFPADDLRFLGRRACEITNVLQQVRGEITPLPPYFEVAFTIAGRNLPVPCEGALLAEQAAGNPTGSGPLRSLVKAAIHLADPVALYARQRQRTWWFGGLVLAAAVTAGVGLLAAQRAFQRQLRLNEMKSNFVSSVSHELRAPIASVRLLAESLDRGKVTDEIRRREYYQLMGQECRRLSALIENVLDFSRIDQGRKQYEFEPADLPAVVSQTVRLMEPYAAERQVTLQAILPSSFGLLPALDARAIQQALVNLMDNAVKHSPPGATVEVSLAGPARPPAPTPETAPAPHRQSPIRLAVQDQGPGIPPSEHARIFEPFYRLGSELRRDTPGIGIGLSIVKHVVEAHRGRVWVESEPGRGTRFVIELPGDPAAPDAAKAKLP